MDYLDGCDETIVNELLDLVSKRMSDHGLGIFRSVSLSPWYIRCFKENDLDVSRNASHHMNGMMDYVNTYASFWTLNEVVETQVASATALHHLEELRRTRVHHFSVLTNQSFLM